MELMARFLAHTAPGRGHLYPLVPVLDELLGRGHEIVLRTMASEVEPMRARGFDTEPLDPAGEHDLDDYRSRSPHGALKRALRALARRAERDVPALRGAIADTRPDGLLVDVNCWGAQAVAEASGLPWSMWCPFPMPLPAPGLPPFGPGLAPARGPVGRTRDALLEPLLTRAYASASLPALNGVRGKVGVPLFEHPTELLERAPLVIYMTAEPFEYPRAHWPENVVLVGPCAWEPPAEPPGWLAGIEAPIVLVTTSSEFQDDGRLVSCALEGLAAENLYVVATLPAQQPSGFSTSANARVERYVPHGLLLDRAVCAVTHAGMGATQKALARGVPVCAVPFGRDQLEVARRVAVCDAGTRLSARRLTPERLRANVQAAIAKRSGAQAIAAAFHAAGGPPAAADAIERQQSKIAAPA
jgi:MGT family glycosyltransferase